MGQINQVFQRVEKKYLLNEQQYQGLQKAMEPYMKMDEYGLHTICNIYFDTKNYDLISRSLEKPVYKEKFRLRSYGVPTEDSQVYLEIKKKYKGVVYKRRAGLKLNEAKNYLLNDVSPKKDSQILREIDFFLHRYRPEPKLYLAYDRIAFYGILDPDFRMTFDTRIRSRETNLFLEDGDNGDLLLPEQTHLLEVKIKDSVPLWLAHALSDLEIYPVSFSKYGSIYSQKHASCQEKEQEQYMEDEECLRVLLNQEV